MSAYGNSAPDAQRRGEAAFSQAKGDPVQVHDGTEQLQPSGSVTGGSSTTTAGTSGASGLRRDDGTGEVTGAGHGLGHSSSTGAGTGSGAGANIGTSTGIPTTGSNPTTTGTATDASVGAVPGGTTGTSSGAAKGAAAGGGATTTTSSSSGNNSQGGANTGAPSSSATAAGSSSTTQGSSSPLNTQIPDGARAHPDNLPQTAKEAPLVGTIAGDNVSFKEQVQGHAKYFAGKIFGNDKEVQEGSARVAGVETAEPGSERAQQAASQASK